MVAQLPSPDDNATTKLRNLAIGIKKHKIRLVLVRAMCCDTLVWIMLCIHGLVRARLCGALLIWGRVRVLIRTLVLHLRWSWIHAGVRAWSSGVWIGIWAMILATIIMLHTRHRWEAIRATAILNHRFWVTKIRIWKRHSGAMSLRSTRIDPSGPSSRTDCTTWVTNVNRAVRNWVPRGTWLDWIPRRFIIIHNALNTIISNRGTTSNETGYRRSSSREVAQGTISLDWPWRS
uniref:Uncharacterized protein n=1 Tax=Opuntia streptacantha TaxID=393608 RepID=A0A7C8ZM66_OPUST